MNMIHYELKHSTQFRLSHESSAVFGPLNQACLTDNEPIEEPLKTKLMNPNAYIHAQRTVSVSMIHRAKKCCKATESSDRVTEGLHRLEGCTRSSLS